MTTIIMPKIYFPLVAKVIETPYNVTLYLNLKNVPKNTGDYQIQTEMFKEKYTELKDRHFPWFVLMKWEHLFFMKN